MLNRDVRKMLAGLLADSHVLSFEGLPDQVSKHAKAAGFTEVLIYLTDLRREALRLVTGEATPEDTAEKSRTTFPVEGTEAGLAFQNGRITPVGDNEEGDCAWWIPLVDGTERLGVLYVRAAVDDEDLRQAMASLASLVAMMIVCLRQASDSYARLTRVKPMNVAAEMQWHLMPPRTYVDDHVAVSALMEPAYEVSGDAYDYATAGRVMHLALFDAMGHDTAAGLTAHLALGACRNLRRRGTALAERGDAIERILMEQFRTARWATGVLAELDTGTGVLTWVNRGHLPPALIRDGRRVTLLDCPPSPPMGSGFGLPTVLCREQLQPGDRLVLYTDGITEARNTAGEEFGEEAFIEFLIDHHSQGLSVSETLRRLMASLLEHHGGKLQDDATILLCEWFGPRSQTASAHSRTGSPWSSW